MPTSLIAPLVMAGVSAGANALFGGSKSDPQIAFQPQGFNAGGLNVGGYGDVTPTATRTNAVSGIGDLYSQQGDILGGLRQTVQPGFNDLLRTRLDSINNSARSAIGDLRQNLASRRVLGSSFGNDTISRLNSLVSQQRDQVTADNFLTSLAKTQELTQQEFSARREALQTGLDELNLEVRTGLAVSGKANDILAKNAQMQAELDAKSAANSGSFYGALVQPVAKAAGTAAGNFFSNLGSNNAAASWGPFAL